jgi:hypothetical protein
MNEDKPELRTLRSDRAAGRRSGRRNHGRIGALLVFGSIAVLIAKQEIPVVDAWVSRLLDEDGWHAAEQCRALARSSTGQAEFTRQLRAGKAERTDGGFYVSGVVLALLDSNGEERTWHFSCNVSTAGEVLAINSTVATDAVQRKTNGNADRPDSFLDP